MCTSIARYCLPSALAKAAACRLRLPRPHLLGRGSTESSLILSLGTRLSQNRYISSKFTLTRSPSWWYIHFTFLIAMVRYSYNCWRKWLIRIAAECIYKKKWAPRPDSSSKLPVSNGVADGQSQPKALSAEDDAKLVFGTIFSLRNMVRKLGGPEDKCEATILRC